MIEVTYVTKKPKQCPFCRGFKIGKILYGEPIFSDKLQEELNSGKIIIGGCCIDRDSPQYGCIDCKVEFTVNKRTARSILPKLEIQDALYVYGSISHFRRIDKGYPEIQIFDDGHGAYIGRLYQVSNSDDNIKTLKAVKGVSTKFVDELQDLLSCLKINLFNQPMAIDDGGVNYLRIKNIEVTAFLTWNVLPDDWQELEKVAELLTGIFPEFDAMICEMDGV